MTTEPTDVELDGVLCSQWPAFSMQATLVRMWVRQAMRAAIARWGQPSGAGEPCGWAIFRQDGSLVHGSSEDSADACLFALSESEVACGQKPGYMTATNGWRPQPLYTTPQPAHAQAGAAPLTCEWTHNDDDGFWETACGEAWRFDDGGPAENSMHFCHSCGKSLCIKGGQHGTE